MDETTTPVPRRRYRKGIIWRNPRVKILEDLLGVINREIAHLEWLQEYERAAVRDRVGETSPSPFTK
ncbi:hypothetical protein GCM10027093_08490 [Paraburkholderia jirisanensis]